MKLHQVIAIEKGIKARVYAFLSETYKTFQKPALFNGVVRTYQKRDEAGEDLPAEQTKVVASADDMLKEIIQNMVEAFDVTAAKDWGNQVAKADLVVDGLVLLRDVPATFLLYLDKQLKDLKAELTKMPELDPGTVWSYDQTTGLYKSEPQTTTRTKKVTEPIVLYHATPEHPAQTQLISRDVLAGTWTVINYSGAVPKALKRIWMDRLNRLTDAVKIAREAANEAEAKIEPVSRPIFDYLFGTQRRE